MAKMIPADELTEWLDGQIEFFKDELEESFDADDRASLKGHIRSLRTAKHKVEEMTGAQTNDR